MKLNYKKTMLIGLGFFTVSIVWSIYNVAVPLYLEALKLSGFTVGLVMSLDNIFAVVFQPFFGSLSDKTNTRYGRRMPYLLIGIPCAALFFFLIPLMRGSIILLMASVICLNFFMSIYRAPTVALMPDFTPAPLRSKANGIINLMGGIGTAAALFTSGALFKLGDIYPFATGSVVLLITIIMMYLFIKEPTKAGAETENAEAEKTGDTDEDARGKKLSLIFLLLAIFFWFTSYNAIETFFSTYGRAVLGIDKSMSSYLLLSVSALFLIFAIPSGIIAGKIGRKKTILTGLVLFAGVVVSLIFIRNVNIMFVLLGLGGIGWALININSYPMVVEMTGSGAIGRYTGYYYFFSMLAAIVSPILFGYLKDILGDDFLFIYSSIGLVLAFFFMMLVRHGEAKPEAKSGLEGIEHMES